MADFDYLEKMFFRLSEAKQFRAKVGNQITDNAEKAMADCWVYAIKNSITDYLASHAAAPKLAGGSDE